MELRPSNDEYTASLPLQLFKLNLENVRCCNKKIENKIKEIEMLYIKQIKHAKYSSKFCKGKGNLITEYCECQLIEFPFPLTLRGALNNEDV